MEKAIMPVGVPIDSAEKAREMGRKGGLKSGETKRKKRMFREYLETALDTVLHNRDGAAVPNPYTGEPMTMKEAAMIKLASNAAKGDAKAIEQAARLLGEWEQTINVNADVQTTGTVVMGFDPLQAVREIYGKEGGDE